MFVCIYIHAYIYVVVFPPQALACKEHWSCACDSDIHVCFGMNHTCVIYMCLFAPVQDRMLKFML